MYSFDRLHYSIRGSYHVWDAKDKNTLKLATIHGHGQDIFNGTLSINFGKGAKMGFTPREVTVKYPEGQTNLTLFGTDGTFIKGNGKDILVEIATTHAKFDYQVVQNGVTELCDFKNNCSLMFVPIKGRIEIEKSRGAGKIVSDFVNVRVYCDENGEFEFAIESDFLNKGAVGAKGMNFDFYADKAEKDYIEWEKKFNCKNKYQKECAYVMWSNAIAPLG
ncbi:MAG: hypothetical protein IKA02_00130, partial [Clostridia bacterium]|nr:hypothetical protein [Clostridia bacterium]